ncbi:hypothetical protein GALMADRAFT_237649 [Galerina marginata CBS 339.88]|uniref:RNA polymerase II-associated protein 3 n=1 Tax=Galerina marginata (strain CBS 339.88) TaxID=685588 RepID=A0A067TTR8_GALM3|nr:hypothetical protein GALMADRAFT_237649 [Galerina marginata CBS 339.88]
MANPKAQSFKEKGNQAFKTGDYPTAIGHYTAAILADRADPTFPLNRAAAYLKLGKHEDAERDCTTVLGLSKNNVKALFRRGQARIGVGKLLEAQKDFTDVLAIEPSNTAAHEELKTVTTLIQKEKAKKSKAPISPVQSSLEPQAISSKRRRVPIRIVDPSGAPVPSPAVSVPSAPTQTASTLGPGPMDVDVDSDPPAQPKPKPKTEPQPQPQPPKPKYNPSSVNPATLEPVSTRSLKPSSAKPHTPPAPPPSASAAQSKTAVHDTAPTPQPPSQSQSQSVPPTAAALPSATDTDTNPAPKPNPKLNATPKPETFKDAKQARQSKSQSQPRVGGGIFRASGESRVFPPRGSEAGSDANLNLGGDKDKDRRGVNGNGNGNENGNGVTPMEIDSPTTKTTTHQKKKNKTVQAVPPPPGTYFEFARTWDRLGTPEERWGYINTIPPAHFPTLCKTSLEPTMLVSVLETFLVILTPSSSSSSSPTSADGDSETETETETGHRNPRTQTQIKAYLTNFAHIPRFGTLVLFLSRKEKEVARGVWEALGVSPMGDVWKGVV